MLFSFALSFAALASFGLALPGWSPTVGEQALQERGVYEPFIHEVTVGKWLAARVGRDPGGPPYPRV